MSICTESTRGQREPVLQVPVAARGFKVNRVNLQEKYDYPNTRIVPHCKGAILRRAATGMGWGKVPSVLDWPADAWSTTDRFQLTRRIELGDGWSARRLLFATMDGSR